MMITIMCGINSAQRCNAIALCGVKRKHSNMVSIGQRYIEACYSYAMGGKLHWSHVYNFHMSS